jgi:hypothetical protein
MQWVAALLAVGATSALGQSAPAASSAAREAWIAKANSVAAEIIRIAAAWRQEAAALKRGHAAELGYVLNPPQASQGAPSREEQIARLRRVHALQDATLRSKYTKQLQACEADARSAQAELAKLDDPGLSDIQATLSRVPDSLRVLEDEVANYNFGP